jgi:hypothetical protein
MLLSVCVVSAIASSVIQQPQVIVVEQDNVEIRASCSIRIALEPIVDADDNGVVHIVGDNIVVDFAGCRLRGAASGQSPDSYRGTGVRIAAKNVIIRNLNVSGFKVGVHAVNADHLLIEDCDISDNFRQRLRSSPQAEDGGDWLWPHANDENEWITNYGAGVCVEDSSGITIRRVRARNVQNGIILDRVTDGQIYDNDCSFLSGWGLGLWRSSGNTISRNAFDFCVRGYSHGVYNRGQDSAGMLMFEQCCDNIIAENSMTHGGDGFFGFGGREALGETPRPPEASRFDNPANWHVGRGCNRNIFIRNDFSDAVAHGLELTFSFDNAVYANRFAGNGICGIWGGYSQRFNIAGNTFERNGDMAYGLERGGVNIEHGRGNWIHANTFADNACGVHLWWDPDEHIVTLPWGDQNQTTSDRNFIYGNTFTRDRIAIHLRQVASTFLIENAMHEVGAELDADEASRANIQRSIDAPRQVLNIPAYEALGDTRPVGARSALAGRQHIIMGEWGPFDFEKPMYVRRPPVLDFKNRPTLVFDYIPAVPHDESQFLFTSYHADPERVDIDFFRSSDLVTSERSMRFSALEPGIHLVRFTWGHTNDDREDLTTMLIWANWSVRQFRSTVDPRENADAWRGAGEQAEPTTLPMLSLSHGHGGPLLADGQAVTDHFGTIATTTLEFPPGRWRVKSLSDDGIRVWLDDALVIDDWTWHGPTTHQHEFEVRESRKIDIRVEHFELDGYAVLSLDIEPVE